MNSTNKEHIILKEKLQGVDLPDVDKAWEKMDQAMEAAVPNTPASTSWLGKFRIYLNIFIGAILVSAIGFYVASKPPVAHDINTPSVNYAHNLVAFNQRTGNSNTTSASTPFNHSTMDVTFTQNAVTNSVHTSTGQSSAQHALTHGATTDRQVSQSDETTTQLRHNDFNTPEESEPVSSSESLDENLPPVDSENTEKTEPVIEDNTSTGDEQNDNIGDEDFGYAAWDKPFARNQVGLKIQTMMLPEFSFDNSVQNTGVALFARTYLNPRSAIHIELGYNPVAIRPVTYVEKSTLFNNVNYTQTDSALVRSLRYVTIPVCYYYQATEQINVVFGPQVSFLTGLKGDMTTILDYPSATEDQGSQRNVQIQNKGGFSKSDIGFMFEFNYQVGRLEAGIKLQQGFGDYTTEKIGTSIHRLSSLQLKAAWLLNK